MQQAIAVFFLSITISRPAKRGGVCYAQGRVRKFAAKAARAPRGEQGKMNLPYSIDRKGVI